MTTLTSRLNIRYSNDSVNAIANEYANVKHWIINNSQRMNAYATLCLICAELSINLSNVDDVDFDTCSKVLESFAQNAIQQNIKNIVVWFN